MALDPVAGLLYVLNVDSSTVAVVDTATLDAAQGRLYISNFDEGTGRTVSVVTTRKRTLLGTIAVGRGPQASVLDAEAGRLYVPNWVSGTVTVIDTHLAP